MPTKTIHCFPDNKSWVIKDLTSLLNENKMAFRSGGEVVKGVQRLLSVRQAYGRKQDLSRTTLGRCAAACGMGQRID